MTGLDHLIGLSVTSSHKEAHADEYPYKVLAALNNGDDIMLCVIAKDGTARAFRFRDAYFTPKTYTDL